MDKVNEINEVSATSRFIIVDLEGRQVVHNRFDTRTEAGDFLNTIVEDKVMLALGVDTGESEDLLRALIKNEYAIMTEVVDGELNV